MAVIGQPVPDFGSVLRQLRAEVRLTQEELAEAAGLSPRTVSDLERGVSRTARKHTAARLADVLGLTGQRAALFVAAARGRVPDAGMLAGRAGDAPLDQASPPRAAAVMVPRELPADVAAFTGRAAELAELSRLLPAAGQEAEPGPVVISVVSGTAGVGKTALAVHWAHRVAGRFPDGQLYVNLRGYDSDQLVSAGDALAGFLRAAGMPGQDIPAGADERAARYRSLLAGRRMLVVLDNAGEAEQVRLLLPGAPACVVVVTSRDALAGLVALDGARRLDLDLLPAADAAGLLRTLIGDRAVLDPDATAALAESCCRLPLALRVAAELAATRPGTPLAELAGELADLQHRLDLLDAGADPRTAVRAVFSWSYRHLDPGAARAFRLAGLHPGPDLDRHAAAALTGTTAEQAGQLLVRLARAHLIQPTRPGRYAMHDLLRGYAAGLAPGQDGADAQRAALTRLFDYYLHSAATAMQTLYPAERRPSLPPLPLPAHGERLLSGPEAKAWLDAELAALVAAVRHAADHGWPGHATRLAATLFRYLDGGHCPEASSIHACARRAARRAGDRAAEATALTSLGIVSWRQGRYERAAELIQQALAMFREISDPAREARALASLSVIDYQRGYYRQAALHLRQTLTLFRETGDDTGEACALINLGLIDSRQGRYQQAARHLRRSLTLFRATGDRVGESYAVCNLGSVDLERDRYQEAVRHLRRSLALFRETGNQAGEAYALAGLGDADLRQGSYQQAISQLRQSLALFRKTGNQAGVAQTLNNLGEALLGDQQPGLARTEYTAALALADQAGDQYEQARAHHGLGRVRQAMRDSGQARRHLQHALTLYTTLGTPEAEQVRAQLGKAGPPGGKHPET